MVVYELIIDEVMGGLMWVFHEEGTPGHIPLTMHWNDKRTEFDLGWDS
jgi:hypothetical protein